MRTKTINIHPETHRLLKQAALDQNTSISALVTRTVPAIAAFIGRRDEVFGPNSLRTLANDFAIAARDYYSGQTCSPEHRKRFDDTSVALYSAIDAMEGRGSDA